MLHRWLLAGVTGVLGLWLWSSFPASAQAQNAPPMSPPISYSPLNRFWYYPYHYFPHNYWPTQGPQYPEPIGAPYRPPPAYMTYPAFREPGWRYEYFEPNRYSRGFHFWLDQF